MYIYIYIYIYYTYIIIFLLTQSVFPTSTWSFCSGGGQVILQRL